MRKKIIFQSFIKGIAFGLGRLLIKVVEMKFLD